jgi:hypothetical protein
MVIRWTTSWCPPSEHTIYNPIVRVCTIEHTPEIFKAIFIAPVGRFVRMMFLDWSLIFRTFSNGHQVFFEVLIGILTVWKAMQYAYVLSNASAGPMLHTMFRDGLFWFLSVVGLQVWNACIWAFLPQSDIYLGDFSFLCHSSFSILLFPRLCHPVFLVLLAPSSLSSGPQSGDTV